MQEEKKVDATKVSKYIEEFETISSEAVKAADELGFPDIVNKISAEKNETRARIFATLRKMYRKVRDDESQFEGIQKQAINIIEALEKRSSEDLERRLQQIKVHFRELEHAEKERKKGEVSRTNKALGELEKMFSNLVSELDEQAREAGVPAEHEEMPEPERTPPHPAETLSSTAGVEAAYTTPSEEQEEHPPEEVHHTAPEEQEAQEKGEGESVEDKINNGIFIILTTADKLEKAETEEELDKARKRFRKSVDVIRDAIQRLLSKSRGPELKKIASIIKDVLDRKSKEMTDKIKEIPDNEALRRKILIEDKRPPGEQGRKLFRLVKLNQEFIGLSKFVEEESAKLA